jgi:hypothetical protein
VDAVNADWLNDEANCGDLQNHLNRYFGIGSDGRPMYTGQYFERFISLSDESHFTAFDVLAAESLSVVIPGEAAYRLVHDRVVERLLHEARDDLASVASLVECDESKLAEGRPLSNLYYHLRDYDDLGRVKVSKLLAAKFPHIVPIRDSLVEQLLGWEDQTEWWLPMRQLAQSVRATIDKLDLPESAPAVTAQRKLDVVLWMEAKARDIKSGAEGTA